MSIPEMEVFMAEEASKQPAPPPRPREEFEVRKGTEIYPATPVMRLPQDATPEVPQALLGTPDPAPVVSAPTESSATETPTGP